jgi:hypothetical protein
LPGRRPVCCAIGPEEIIKIRIISDISKVPLFPPKIHELYSWKFFRTKGDYKSESSHVTKGTPLYLLTTKNKIPPI